MTSHRSGFVLYFVFFFIKTKNTQPNEPGSAPPGVAWQEGPAERLAPETPGEEAAAQTPQAL